MDYFVLCATTKRSIEHRVDDSNQSYGEVMSDGGKGDKRRPTDEQKYKDNYEKIFRKKPKEPEKEKKS